MNAILVGQLKDKGGLSYMREIIDFVRLANREVLKEKN